MCGPGRTPAGPAGGPAPATEVTAGSMGRDGPDLVLPGVDLAGGCRAADMASEPVGVGPTGKESQIEQLLLSEGVIVRMWCPLRPFMV